MSDDNLELSRRKILASAGAVGLAGAGAGLGTSALFSDEEGFVNNSITAGTLDMSVTAEVVAANDEYLDGIESPSAVIDYSEEADGDVGLGLELGDVKPGDWVIVCVDIVVLDNPGCVTVFTENLTNDDNGLTEPEENEAGDTTGGDGEGELGEHLVAEVYEDFTGAEGPSADPPRDMLSGLDDTTPAGTSLNDFDETYNTGVTIGGGTSLNTVTWYLLLELPRETGNVVQSDSVTFDTRFSATQARNNGECVEPGDDVGECPDCGFSPGSTDDEVTNLLSVGPDPTAGYPAVDARMRVDSPAGTAGSLGPSNFAVCENGCGQTVESVDFESGGAVDLVVVFDDTGSMGGEISTMKSNVNSLTDDLEAAGVDARYALVSFEDEAELDQDFTDASTFDSAVDDLSASGGGDTPEDNIDALAVGTGNAAGQQGDGSSLSSFRSGAQRVVVDITDVGAYDSTIDSRARFTQAEIETFLDDGNFTFYAVSPDDPLGGNVDKQDIANNVDDGTWIDIFDADFDVILNDIVADITDEAYVISYTTTNPATDGSTRNVDVEVDDPDEGLLYEAGSYTAPTS